MWASDEGGLEEVFHGWRSTDAQRGAAQRGMFPLTLTRVLAGEGWLRLLKKRVGTGGAVAAPYYWLSTQAWVLPAPRLPDIINKEISSFTNLPSRSRRLPGVLGRSLGSGRLLVLHSNPGDRDPVVVQACKALLAQWVVVARRPPHAP